MDRRVDYLIIPHFQATSLNMSCIVGASNDKWHKKKNGELLDDPSLLLKKMNNY